MRGLGIILVVVGHLWRWPGGVFAMLDMFFVLSGFLITAILVKALAKYGPGFLVVFALNRVRRLMPAALTVLALTIALTYVVFTPARGALVAEDALWAALLVVNWHFAVTGTDYFRDDAAGSPLLHYWSLSIEEQFYAVWPLLILGLLAFAARRRSKSPTTTLAVGITTIGLAAFAYSMWHSTSSPVTAYFSTVDRTWEFCIGGLVAVFASKLARLPRWSGVALSWGGTIGLLLTLYFLPYGVAFPAPYGLFPALLTAAIIVGGLERETSYIPLLDNRVMIYLGDLSYSIYLVHLPVNVLLRPLFSPGAASYYLAAIATTLVAAAACYYLVERPMRDAPWLMTKPERERQQQAERAGPAGSAKDPRGLVDGRLVLVALATTVVAVIATLPFIGGQDAAVIARPLSQESVSSAAPRAAADQQQDRVRAALDAEEFPDFSPPLADQGTEQWYADLQAQGCSEVDETNVDDCVFGDASATKTALVVGDSFAMSWMPGLREALVPRGWRVQQMTSGQCPTWTLPSYVTLENRPNPACAAQHNRAEAFARDTRPDLVILASASEQVRNAERDDLPDDSQQLAEDGLLATVEAMKPYAGRIAVLQPWVTEGALTQCVSRFTGPAACESRRSDSWSRHVGGEQVAARMSDVDYVETEDWFCAERRCPGFVGTTPVTADGFHLSVAFSESLAPLLEQALLEQALLD